MTTQPNTLALIASTARPSRERAAAHDRFVAILHHALDEEGETIVPELCAVDDAWKPVFDGSDHLLEALATVRRDSSENLACALSMATMTPEQLRGFAASLSLDAAEELLGCMAEYKARVEGLLDAVRCGFGRGFAACYERHGLPSRPSLSVVEG